MSPLATTLLCAIRYAHGRSLHPYEDVIAGVREVWHLIDETLQQSALDLLDRMLACGEHRRKENE